MDGGIRIFELCESGEEYVSAINALLAQLSSNKAPFGMAELEALVAAPATHLFILELNGAVVGMLTLCEYLAPTGRKMWIEDVVVDSAVRGRSLGRALVEHAVDYAASLGNGSLMLTSRPSRVAANALYRSCGFEQRETNVYRMKLAGRNK